MEGWLIKDWCLMVHREIVDSRVLPMHISDSHLPSRSSQPGDEALVSAKQEIQSQCREAIGKGILKQSDVFLVRPEAARRATFSLKA
jgi:hypothetical protein